MDVSKKCDLGLRVKKITAFQSTESSENAPDTFQELEIQIKRDREKLAKHD